MLKLKTVISFTFLLWCIKALASFSHGPMLGDLGESNVAIWVRTSLPMAVRLELQDDLNTITQIKQLKTTELKDNTSIFRLQDLEGNTQYHYTVYAGKETLTGKFKTLDRAKNLEPTRIEFGSCYFQDNLKSEGGNVFKKMYERNPDFVLFTGDLPYTKKGRLNELRDGHKLFRTNEHFSKLASNVPIYAIYDDHDFGTDNSDGTFKYKHEALQAFNEYWPNPPTANGNNLGIYTSFVHKNAEIFLLDTRYFSQQSSKQPDMLGVEQTSWLCSGLKNSVADHKIIVSGPSLSSTNADGWSGQNFSKSKSALFSCIYENEISGVFVISGDSHRSEFHKYRLGGWFSGNYLYEFTSSPLKNDVIESDWPNHSELIYSYKDEDSQFGELLLSGKSQSAQVDFRIMSPKVGKIKQLTLRSDALTINKDKIHVNYFEIMAIASIIALIAYLVYRKKLMQ